MSVAQWTDQYLVGFDEIDDEHKQLFSILSSLSLYCLMTNNHQEEEVKRIIQELLDYTNQHFSAEESFMADVQYPGLLQHHRRHKEFTDSVLTYQKEAAVEGMAVFIAVKLANTGSQWLSEHILVADKQFEQFLVKKELA